MDTTFLLTVLFLLASSFLGIILKGRSRDRCLKDFHGFPVCVSLLDGKEIWGRLRVANSGLEMCYERPHSEAGYSKSSTLLFNGEFDQIWQIGRPAGELDAKDEEERSLHLERMVHPSALRGIGRRFRNLVSSLRDAVLQIVGMTVQQAKKMGSDSKVLATQDKYITKMGQEALTSSLYEYDVLLERLIGKQVVVERFKEGRKLEWVGVLANYTATFLEVLDCKLAEEHVIQRGSPLIYRFRRFLEIVETEDVFSLKRLGGPEVEPKAWLRNGEERPAPQCSEIGEKRGLDVGEAVALPDWLEGGAIKLSLRRRMDLVLPRASAVVRHAAEQG